MSQFSLFGKMFTIGRATIHYII